MKVRFAERTGKVGRSFIREILKVTSRPDVISFAGGLPNPRFFPVAEMAEACARVFADDGAAALQYQESEGYPPLREYVAEHYRRSWGFEASPEDILITSGSQQALDLVGKVFIDKGARVILERPAYLGAIQAFGMYEPEFVHVPLEDDGMNGEALSAALSADGARLVYAVPNFQNPSGVTYSAARREAVATAVAASDAVLIEDDPYGEIRFAGEPLRPMRYWAGERTVMLGTFSKTVAPGLRIGWVWAARDIIERLIAAKQAADLHSDSLSQRALVRYLAHTDIAARLGRLRGAYRARKDAMLAAIREYCPPEVKCTEPLGGMFVWMTLPRGLSSLELFDKAIEAKVAFVPGTPFYVDGGGDDTMRLNFSNSDEDDIEEGISRLGKAMRAMGA